MFAAKFGDMYNTAVRHEPGAPLQGGLLVQEGGKIGWLKGLDGGCLVVPS